MIWFLAGVKLYVFNEIDMERNKNNKTGGYGIGRSVSDLLEHIAAGA